MSKNVTKIELNSPMEDLKGVGPKKAQCFAKAGILQLSDMLWDFPRDYEDLRSRTAIADLKEGEKTLVVARVIQARFGRGFGRKRTFHVLAEDATGRLDIIFFMAGFMGRTFTIGEEYRFYGKPKLEKGRAVMFQPTFSKADDDAQGGILPVYTLTRGVTQKEMRRFSRLALELAEGQFSGDKETLPASVIESANLCSLEYALRNVHYPEGREEYSQARYRLVYEELFDLKTALMLSKDRFGSGRKGIAFTGKLDEVFVEKLPYELTNAQKRCLLQIRADMASPQAMNRLIQGDVGSGKTAVAQCAMLKAVSSGYQAAFMAPTELLAAQHLETLTRDFEGLDVNVVLLTGSQKASERKKTLAAIESGEADIVVGTHAVISEKVKFKALGLVITDEQHRFGVNQRQMLTAKGENPDVLVMTATPIPRTLAVVLYGDLDVSIIDELPPGRKPIVTKRYDEETRAQAYDLMAQQVAKGRQAYIVAPLIADSESIESRSAESLFEELQETYPKIRFALLHGAMKQAEKDAVMEAFYRGETDVLVSTVVIEVGINVPNACVMLIENAERFGLAQLHQLRGRVGRGSEQSWCLIVTGEDSDIARMRAETMCESSDGFYIAEKDLEMRGPGELFGFRQHGLPQLKLADPVRHVKVVERAAQDAEALLAADPGLTAPENAGLKSKIDQTFATAGELIL
ncbi:MAG: ATP-dependent DNA helicase RecG [Firmicutes bacterium]|nr:ATP-dependent DNA helicase RecG [Bacillota bacterium]